MQRITVKEYFDYLNEYIDNLSDEELLKLLEDEVLDKDLYDTFCYNFELVPPDERVWYKMDATNLIYNFYLFLKEKINIIEKLNSVICIGFRSIDFEEFYRKYFEEKIKDFDEDSLKKLSKIINLMKKEYKILEKQQVNISEKIAWLEDALYILKKHIENICKYKRVVGNEKK